MDMISLYNIKRGWRDEEGNGKTLERDSYITSMSRGIRESGAWYHKRLHCLVG